MFGNTDAATVYVRSSRSAAARGLAALTVVWALLAGAVPIGAAQEAIGSISVRVATCPPGTTSETLVLGTCDLVGEGFDLELTAEYGASRRGLAEAASDPAALTYTWTGLPVAPSSDSGIGDPYFYSLAVNALPAGYADFLVYGDRVIGDGVRLEAAQPSAALTVYAFQEAPPSEEPANATYLTIANLVCPAGYAGDAYAADCTEPGAGNLFQVTRPNSDAIGDFTRTDGDGLVTFEVGSLGANGSVGMGAQLPPGVDDYAVVCATIEDGERIVTGVLIGRPGFALVIVPITAGVDLRCDWYYLPAGEPGDEDEPTATSDAGNDEPAATAVPTSDAARRGADDTPTAVAEPDGTQEADGGDGPAAAGDTAAVVAQGVAAAPADEVAWRVVADTAEPADEATTQERALGFVLADEGALLVDGGGDGERLRLAPGEAAFVPEGAQQRRTSLAETPVRYYRLGLVPAEQADDTAGDELVLAGDNFAAPPGERDLDLVRVPLGEGESAELASGDAPALAVVVAGAVDVVVDGTGAGELAAGEAAALLGDLQLTAASAGGAIVYVAVIGPEVQPSSGEGDGARTDAAPPSNDGI